MKNKERINLLEKALGESNHRLDVLEKAINKEPETGNEYKAGDWVWKFVFTDTPMKLVIIDKFLTESTFQTKDIKGNLCGDYNTGSVIRKAKDKEVEKALIEEAVKRGYKTGIRLKGQAKRGMQGAKWRYEYGKLFDADCCIWSPENGWAEIITPDYENSLGEVFYYGDKVYKVKPTLQIFDFIYNSACVGGGSNKATEMMTKQSAEKWIEDRKVKRCFKDGSYYRVVYRGLDHIARYYKYNDFWVMPLHNSSDYVKTTDFDLIGGKIEFN